MVTSQKMSENEMGYRGSKSITCFKSVIVKEQRVDGDKHKYYVSMFKVYSDEFRKKSSNQKPFISNNKSINLMRYSCNTFFGIGKIYTAGITAVSFEVYTFSILSRKLNVLKNTRHFSSYPRVLKDNHNIDIINKSKVKYDNADIDKVSILLENKNKSGIYLWTNLINGKIYIGSSVNLSIRLLQYFNTNYLLRNTSMTICRALLKHGYSNFSLTIVEYCESDKCLIRVSSPARRLKRGDSLLDKYYLLLLNPDYNIASDPVAPFFGRKHSLSSIKKMSDANKEENHPNFGNTGDQNPMFGKKHSDETRQRMADANKGENNPNFGKPKAEGAGKPSQPIEVFDNNTNETTSYDSISAAARALNIESSRISEFFSRNQKKPYKGIYMFKKI